MYTNAGKWQIAHAPKARAQIDVVAIGELECCALDDALTQSVSGIAFWVEGARRVGERKSLNEPHPLALHNALHVDARRMDLM